MSTDIKRGFNTRAFLLAALGAPMRYSKTMTEDPQIATLLHPFDTGMLEWPSGTADILCIGFAESLPDGWKVDGEILYVQGFRPGFTNLERAGQAVMHSLPTGRLFDIALVRLGRHRGQNEAWIAKALRLMKTGGLVLVAGAKTDGVASMRKHLSRAGAEPQYMSKNHGQVLWLEAGEDRLALADQLEPASLPLVDGRYQTAPGMFSAGQIDRGSRLLSDQISCRQNARVADFCAGWGYLSVQFLKRCPDIACLHLYEADFASLQAARANLAGKAGCEIDYLWFDLLHDQVDQRYDLIVMNPPFHAGRRAEPEIGRRLIAVAAKALAPRGHLLLVANHQLPYEEIIGECFSSHHMLCEEDGFKVLSAKR